jgi:anthranilate synthase component II
VIVMVDNYDSFTWNVYQLLCERGAIVEVVRNDAISAEQLLGEKPAGIVISPGPGSPADAGISLEVIRAAQDIPLLGVCLGMQCMAEAFGGQVVRAGELVHGKATPVTHDDRGVFAGLPQPFAAGRYHSLAVPAESLPAELEVSARTARQDGDGDLVMGLRHRSLPYEGVQFHPESILTPDGGLVLENFLRIVNDRSQEAA